MTTSEQNSPDFDDIADIFWRLGVMSSPSQLQGYLLGLLAVGHSLAEGEWLQLAIAFIDPVQPPAEVDQQTLLELLAETKRQLEEGGMELQMLMPDDAIEITQRVDSLSQWCKGFLAGFALGGKQRQQELGQQQYPEDVAESLRDMAAISQAALGEGDEDEQEREHSFFELSEYLRLAAINIYLECQHMASAAPAAEENRKKEEALGQPGNLFVKPPGSNKLH